MVKPGAVAFAGDGTWLFVLPWELHHPGGVNQVVQNLFDANERILGGHSLLIVKTWDRRDAEPGRVDTRATLRVPFRTPWSTEHPWRSLSRFLRWLPGAILELRGILKRKNVECIHVHYPDLDALIWPILRLGLRRRPRLVLSFHGVDLNAACASRGFGRLLWRALLAMADETVVCGEGLLQQIAIEFPSVQARVRMIDNGVDPRGIRAAAVGPRCAQAPAMYLCSLGTFEHKKGHDITLAAFDELAQRYPQLGLVIAGRRDDEATFARLESQRRSLRAADRVLLLPDLGHDEAMRWLRDSAVFVLASRAEPFGIVVLEAGVLRRPVVATSICGAVRRLRVGDELLVVPSGDVTALAQAIERLLSDPELAERIATALQQHVESSFTWNRIVQQYVHAAPAAAPAAR
jgi:glycosyltransferase involved in cell wall biosynthesis